MSEEQLEYEELGFQDDDPEVEEIEAGEEFEEISSDEVDRIVVALEELIESADSENIKCQLEEALNSVYYLVYDEESEEDDDGDVAVLSDAA